MGPSALAALPCAVFPWGASNEYLGLHEEVLASFAGSARVMGSTQCGASASGEASALRSAPTCDGFGRQRKTHLFQRVL